MKCSTAGSYTPDDLHELSFALGHSGELFAHFGTNFMKTGWFKGDNSIIKGLKTELKATYDLDQDEDSTTSIGQNLKRQLTTTASCEVMFLDKLALAATLARLAPD